MLTQIVDHKRQEVQDRKVKVPVTRYQKQLLSMPPSRSLLAALQKHTGKMKVIAELKKASPSRGVFDSNFDLVELAGIYDEAGACAISVVTEEKFFSGEIKNLALARSASQLPLLRKDFLIDSYQLYESRCSGADAVLLIAGIQEGEKLRDFLQLSEELGLECLVEVHSPEELEKALTAGARIVGVNNRRLQDFSVSLSVTADISRQVPKGVPVVSESGIEDEKDATKIASWDVDAILVGESLVTAEDPGTKLRKFKVELEGAKR